MPVASCVATGTALRAAIRSLLAREGVPLKLPLPSALYQGRQRVLAALHRRTGDGMPCARRSPGRRTALSTSPQ